MSRKRVKLRRLVPSFANPKKWRMNSQVQELDEIEWQTIRRKILARYDYTCQYCGYRSEKYQIVHHLDGDPAKNDERNLTVICQMCNLIEHSGQGCVIKGMLDLYKKSKYSQNEIIKITRQMRDQGKSDDEIISFLGLTQKVPFRMDRRYLSGLYCFVTSRPTRTGDDMHDRRREYHERLLHATKELDVESSQVTHNHGRIKEDEHQRRN